MKLKKKVSPVVDVKSRAAHASHIRAFEAIVRTNPMVPTFVDVLKAIQALIVRPM